MSVLECIQRKGHYDWICALCKSKYDDAFPLISHLVGDCTQGFVSRSHLTPTESFVNMYAAVDRDASEGMLQAYIRVNYVSSRFIPSLVVHADVLMSAIQPKSMISNPLNMQNEGSMTFVEGRVADLDLAIDSDGEELEAQPDDMDGKEDSQAIDSDRGELETQADDMGGDEDDQASGAEEDEDTGGQEFPATPPRWLSDEEKEEWKVRQDRKLTTELSHHLPALYRTIKPNLTVRAGVGKIREIINANIKPNSRSDKTAIMSAWNTTYGSMPGYNQYIGYRTLENR